MCQAHDKTETFIARTSRWHWLYFISPFVSVYNFTTLHVATVSIVTFAIFSRNLPESIQDKSTGLCATAIGDIIFPNELFCLMVASLYWIKIWAIRWEKPEQSSCAIYNVCDLSNVMYCMVVCKKQTNKRIEKNRNNIDFTAEENKFVVKNLLPKTITELAFIPLYGLRRGTISLRRKSAKTSRLNLWPGSSTRTAWYPSCPMADITVIRFSFFLTLIPSARCPFGE